MPDIQPDSLDHRRPMLLEVVKQGPYELLAEPVPLLFLRPAERLVAAFAAAIAEFAHGGLERGLVLGSGDGLGEIYGLGKACLELRVVLPNVGFGPCLLGALLAADWEHVLGLGEGGGNRLRMCFHSGCRV